MNPKRLPKVSVPKKSPIRFPNAAYSGGVTATYTIIRVFFQTAGRSRITRPPVEPVRRPKPHRCRGRGDGLHIASDPPIIASPRMT